MRTRRLLVAVIVVVLVAERPASAASGRVTYHHGHIMHSSQVHAMFWGAMAAFPGNYVNGIHKFIADVAADSGKKTNVYSVMTQYRDKHRKAAKYAVTFASQDYDATPYPSSECTVPMGFSYCFTQGQLNYELVSFITSHGYKQGFGHMYFMFLPPGVLVCGGPSGPCAAHGATTGFCAFHSSTGNIQKPVIVAYMPYMYHQTGCDPGEDPNNTGTDGMANLISHEHIESITDPEATGLWDPNLGDAEGEIADLCVLDFGTELGGSSGAYYNQVINGSHYHLQQEWSNKANACVQHR